MLQRHHRLNMIRAGIIAFSAMTLTGLSACGQKGPLYLEDKTQNTQTQQTDSEKDKPEQK